VLWTNSSGPTFMLTTHFDAHYRISTLSSAPSEKLSIHCMQINNDGNHSWAQQ
jgi:hypothetical protein